MLLHKVEPQTHKSVPSFKVLNKLKEVMYLIVLLMVKYNKLNRSAP